MSFPPVALSDSRVIKCAHLLLDDKHRRAITRVMNMDVSNYSLYLNLFQRLNESRLVGDLSNFHRTDWRRMISRWGNDVVLFLC
jgi:hypothetical protein